MNSHELCKKKSKELVAQMTLEEKASQLTYNSPAIKRLGFQHITGGMKPSME